MCLQPHVDTLEKNLEELVKSRTEAQAQFSDTKAQRRLIIARSFQRKLRETDEQRRLGAECEAWDAHRQSLQRGN